MGVVPVRSQARDAAAAAIAKRDDPRRPWTAMIEEDRDWYRELADLVIEVFLAAEEIQPEYELRRRLCGPWRRDGNG